MKYYRLDNSVDTKVIGRHTIQLTFADKKSLEEMKKYEDELFPNDIYVVLDVLRIHDSEKYDMLFFPDVDVTTKYISEKLANMLKSEKITGIGLYPCDDIENLE